MFARAKSRYHSTGVDRVDELPAGSLDDDRGHMLHGHYHILRGHSIRHAPTWSHGMQFRAGNIQDIYRGADQQDIRLFLSKDIDFVLFDFHSCHLKCIPGKCIYIIIRVCPFYQYYISLIPKYLFNF